MNTVRCNNMTTFAKLDAIWRMVKKTNDDVGPDMFMDNDPAVVVEALMMASISKNCNHKAGRRTGLMAYERMNVPLERIPSYVGQMEMGMSASPNTAPGRNLRHNLVTNACISDSLSVYEFMMRVSDRGASSAKLVIDSSPSVTHAAVVAILFKRLSLSMHMYDNVTLIILANKTTFNAMKVYAERNRNVRVVLCGDPTTSLYTTMNEAVDEYTTVVTSSVERSAMLMHLSLNSNVDINLNVPMPTLSFESKLRSFMEESDMIAEMSPCSDPGLNMVRIVPVERFDDPSTRAVIGRDPSTPMYSAMRWYGNMIRCMNMGKMCHDCMVARMFARTILIVAMGRDVDENDTENTDWAASFERDVCTDGIVDS